MSSPTPVHAGPLVATFLPPGEPVLFSARPSLWWIVLAHPMRTLWWPAAWLLFRLAERAVDRTLVEGQWPLAAAIAGLCLALLWSAVQWNMHACVLTPRRVLSVQGVLRQTIRDLPLGRVQNLGVHRSFGERVLGLGSILLASASDSTGIIVWPCLGSPERALAAVREAVDHDRRGP